MTGDHVATWVRPDGSVHDIGSTADRAQDGLGR